MRLWAIADLHLAHRANREALEALPAFGDDWLIVAGDVGERPDRLVYALEILRTRFARIFWTPGNHDLWSRPDDPGGTRGVARYRELVDLCRAAGVVTPEDPYVPWPPEPDTFIVPMFLLFDYTFRPPDIEPASALAWAREHGIVSADELMLSPAPWPSRDAWCAARVTETLQRLTALPPDARTILINHWPLRYDLARPPRIPRFSLWCGTRETEDWGERFRARAVISGHLHFRTTLWRHGVRYDEVSLGYPRDWQQARGIEYYLRQVLPANGPFHDRFAPPRDPFISTSLLRSQVRELI